MSLKIDGGLFTYDFIDHHAILCVPVDAEFKEIRNRYLQIARILHPDSSSVVGEPAKEIANQLLAKLVNPAYEKFSVEQNRHEYLFILSQMGKRFAQEPETIKLKTELANQLLASPNITTLYKEAIAKIAKTQFSDFQQVRKIIAQVSELNLVYLMWVAKRSINQSSTQPENSPKKLQSTPTLPSQAESAVGEYLQRAQNLLEINQLLQAKVELQDALKLEPQNSRCHSLMAMVYLRNNQLKMAKIHFDHALKLDPKEKIALEWKPKVDKALGGNNSVNKEKQIDKPENRRWFPNLFDREEKIMVYQPAAGARDLLPLDVAQKRWIEDRLEQVFQCWGYHQIITSTLERMDTLMAGEAIQRHMVIQLQNGQNEELGLRPELTASIARTVATRMTNATYPQRLYYNANVFRRNWEGRHNRQQEYYQAGVELLGAEGLLANAEVLLLVADCLTALNLQNWRLILGEAGITRSLLNAFPPNIRNQVRTAIAHLDYVTLDTLPMEEELRQRAKIMVDLRGDGQEVLRKVSSLDLEPDQHDAINNLKSLVELLEGKLSLILDLSLIQTIDYYTGIVFEVVSETNSQTQILGSGGRYDQLLGLYHPQGENIPGIGFELNIDDLYEILLLNQQLPQHIPASHWLVVSETSGAEAAAFAFAENLRNTTDLVRVEMDLGNRNAAAIRQYASDRSITKIAWIKADGSHTIEAES